jgi:hypothetical protein
MRGMEVRGEIIPLNCQKRKKIAPIRKNMDPIEAVSQIMPRKNVS